MKPGDKHQPADLTTHKQQMLLDFLRDYDAACPVCGYNVRALTRPVCPECRHELTLTVGAEGGRLHLGWLMAAVAPGFFSGIAAFFVLILIVARYVFGDGRFSPLLNAMDVFGWCSGIFAILLCSKRARTRFLAQPRSRQIWCAAIIWLVHVAALGMVFLLARWYL